MPKLVLFAGVASLTVAAMAMAQSPQLQTKPVVNPQFVQPAKELEKKLDVVRPKVKQFYAKLIPGMDQRVSDATHDYRMMIYEPSRVGPNSALMTAVAGGNPRVNFSGELKGGKLYPFDIEIWRRPTGGAGNLVVDCGAGQEFRYALSVFDPEQPVVKHLKFELRPQNDGFMNCTLAADPQTPGLTEYEFRAVEFREL